MKKLIGILLTLVMAVSFIPLQALGSVQELRELAETYEDSQVEQYEPLDIEEYVIIDEVMESRSVNEKEFLLSDGSFVMASYANAVHYEQDGEWADIDNSLTLQAATRSVGDFSGYTNTANILNVKFAEQLSDDVLYRMRLDQYTVSVSLVLEDLALEKDFAALVAKDSEQELVAEEVPVLEQEEITQPETEALLPEENIVPPVEQSPGVEPLPEQEPQQEEQNEESAVREESLDLVPLFTQQELQAQDEQSQLTEELEPEPGAGQAVLVQNAQAPQVFSAQRTTEKSMDLSNITSVLEYTDALANVELQYTLQGTSVKEDIILNTPEASNSYSFRIAADNLNVELFHGSYVSFTDKETGEEVFFISAPYIYDADHTMYLGENFYTLEQQEDGAYILTVTVDREWLDAPERAYPVVIDPTITTNYGMYYGSGYSFKTGYVSSFRPTTSYGGSTVVQVGQILSGGVKYQSRGYLQWTLPTIPAGSAILGATLRLRVQDEEKYDAALPNQTLPITAYLLNNNMSWSQSGLTWNNQPATTAQPGTLLMPIDSRKVTNVSKANYNRYSAVDFDVTQAAQGWYQNTITNNGLVFALNNENATHCSFVNFFSPANNTHIQQETPYFFVNYRNVTGLESYWDTYSHAAAANTAGHVNLYNGNLVLQTSIFTDRTLRMPFSYTYTYNSAKSNQRWGAAPVSGAGNNTDATGPWAGYGWMTNVGQVLYPTTLTGYKYIYIDADGTPHFYKDVNGIIRDEDGMGSYIDDTWSSTHYILKFKDGTKLFFLKSGTGKGRLEKIQTMTDTITISYNSTNTAFTVNSPGGRVSSTTAGSYFLNRFTSPLGTTTTMSLSATLNYIQLGADNSNAKVTFTYDTAANKYRLLSATDTLGRRTEYTYNALGQVTKVASKIYSEPLGGLFNRRCRKF